MKTVCLSVDVLIYRLSITKNKEYLQKISTTAQVLFDGKL